MFGSVILDTAIGLILVYLLLSLIASAVQEGIAGWMKLRSSYLERGVREMLRDPALVESIYEHPIISALYRGTYAEAKEKRDLPSYIPSRSFSLALMDLIVRGRDLDASPDAGPHSPVLSLATVRQRVSRLENKRLQRVVLSAIDTAQGDFDAAQRQLETWFDSSMDRVAGWYKRRTHYQLLLIGIVTAIVVDVNTIRVAERLYADPSARSAAVAMAGSITKDSAALQRPIASQSMARLDSLQLPIGWSGANVTGAFGTRAFFTQVAVHIRDSILGWILTAFAISFGAPFWFDLLNKIMVIRSTVKPHEKSPEEASQDKQESPPPTIVAPTAVPAPASVGAGSPSSDGGGHDDPGFVPNEWDSGHPDGGIL